MPELRSVPPVEAIAALEARGITLHPSFSWMDVSAEEHGASFTVAKSTGFDILKDIHQSLRDTLAQGGTYDQWVKTIRPVLIDKGWWGRKPVIDPADGLVKEATLGTPRRLRTIFDANMRVSYAAGRWAQIQRVKERRPYLVYSAVLDGRTRQLHRSWNNIVRPVDDPFWDTHFPPNGWHCRCSIRQMSERDLQRYGLSVSPPQTFRTKTFENDRTGEVTQVPVGIDPGWGHNPGRTARDADAARVYAEKWADGPPEMVAAIESANRRQVLPGLAKGFGAWVDGYDAQLDAARSARAARQPEPPIRTTGERRVVGALSQPLLDALAHHGHLPKSGAMTVNDRALVHMLRDAKVHGFTVDMIKRLPDLLADPKAVLWDDKDPALVYVFDAVLDLGKFVVRVDFGERVRGEGGRHTVTTNAVTTGGTAKPADFAERLHHGGPPRYVPLIGSL